MKVCVITGGGSGMGLEAARTMPNDRVFLLSGRTQSKLEMAAERLKAEGKQAYVMTCDTSDRSQVHELARYAATLGEITNVIHAAGLSPSMADPEKLLRMCRLVKDSYKSAGLAYALSKNFAVWYAQESAFELGSRGIRVCSISPGLIATDMGELEKGESASMLKYTAKKRMGTPEELGFAIAMAADERNGYLAGVDRGSTNGKMNELRQ